MNEALFYLASNFWLGASHAVLPGHGKTIAAAYVVGARGRPTDAIVLGILVTLSHTSGVVLLFLILATLGTTFQLSDRIQGYLGLATGLIVTGLGLWMLRSRRDRLLASLTPGDGAAGEGGVDRMRADHAHGHDGGGRHDGSHAHDGSGHEHPHPAPGHEHGERGATPGHPHEHIHEHGSGHPHPHGPEHPHAHHHEHAHEHASTGVQARGEIPHSHGWGIRHRHRLEALAGARANLPGLFGIAIADGLLPDPAALGLLLSAMVKGKVLLGLSSVVAYSIGFAAVLAVVGIVAAIAGQIVLRWLSGRWVAWLQTGAAVLVVVVGIVLAANAWRRI